MDGHNGMIFIIKKKLQKDNAAKYIINIRHEHLTFDKRFEGHFYSIYNSWLVFPFTDLPKLQTVQP